MMSDDKNGFNGRHVRAIRAALGWTIADLGNVSGVDLKEIQSIEDGGDLFAFGRQLCAIIDAFESAGIKVSEEVDGRIKIVFSANR